jgi:hypothetical protein
MTVLSPLNTLGVPNASLIVSYWLTDVEFIKGALTTFVPSPQGKTVVPGEKAEGKKPIVHQPKVNPIVQNIKHFAEGVKATTEVTLESVKLVKGLKTLGGAIKEIGSVVVQANAMLMLAGLSKPNAAPGIVATSLIGDRYMVNYDGVFNGYVLGMSSQAANVIPQNLFSEAPDPMDIQTICSRRVLLTTALWVEADPSSTLLLTIPVTPAAYTEVPVTFAAQPNSLFLLSQLFDFWRGDLVYEFEVVKTAQHFGSLTISVDHSLQNIVPANLSQVANLYRVYWDITADTHLKVVVPYLSPTPLEDCSPGRIDRDTRTMFHRAVFLTTATPLGSTPQVPAEVAINVYVSMRNAQFVNPSLNTYEYEAPGLQEAARPQGFEEEMRPPPSIDAIHHLDVQQFHEQCQKRKWIVNTSFSKSEGWHCRLTVTSGHEVWSADGEGWSKAVAKKFAIYHIRRLLPEQAEPQGKVVDVAPSSLVYDSESSQLTEHVLGPGSLGSPDSQFHYYSAEVVYNLRQILRRMMYMQQHTSTAPMYVHDYVLVVPLFKAISMLYVFVTGGCRFNFYTNAPIEVMFAWNAEPLVGHPSSVVLEEPTMSVTLPMVGHNHLYVIRSGINNNCRQHVRRVTAGISYVWAAGADDSSMGGLRALKPLVVGDAKMSSSSYLLPAV